MFDPKISHKNSPCLSGQNLREITPGLPAGRPNFVRTRIQPEPLFNKKKKRKFKLNCRLHGEPQLPKKFPLSQVACPNMHTWPQYILANFFVRIWYQPASAKPAILSIRPPIFALGPKWPQICPTWHQTCIGIIMDPGSTADYRWEGQMKISKISAQILCSD